MRTYESPLGWPLTEREYTERREEEGERENRKWGWTVKAQTLLLVIDLFQQRLHFLNLPKQYNQVGRKCLNKRAHIEHFFTIPLYYRFLYKVWKLQMIVSHNIDARS